MDRRIRISFAVGTCLLLAACAGRAPAPVSVVQPQDRYMDCAAINAEVQANNKKVSELGREEGGKVAQNVIAGAAGLFIPILWFGMDFQNAAGKEVAALQARQQYLATLAEQRCGAVPPVPVQTVQAAVASSPATTSEAPRTFQAKGKTDAWCQTPTLSLTVNGASVEGGLSEVSGGAVTGTVKGTASGDSLALSITSSSPDLFSGDVTGTRSGEGYRVAFQARGPKACNYTFDLLPGAAR